MKLITKDIFKLLFPFISFIFHFTVFIINFFLTFVFFMSSGLTYYVYVLVYPCYIDTLGVDCTTQVFDSAMINILLSFSIGLIINVVSREKIQKTPLSLIGIIGGFVFLNICISYPIIIIFKYIFIESGYGHQMFSVQPLVGLTLSVISTVLTYSIIRQIFKS